MSRPRIIPAALALGLAAILTGILGCCESTTNSPGPVAVAWLQAMTDEDVGRACELMDASSHRSYPGATSAEKCESKLLHLDNTPPNWKPKPNVMDEWGVNDAHVWKVDHPADDQATVWAYGEKGIGRRPGGIRYRVELVREDDHWLVHEMEYPL